MSTPSTQRFSTLRTIKIGTFHIGSAFADLLTSGVLNRVLITDLGIAATPVALLSALRYLLAPLSIWAGHRSDTEPVAGYHRLPYIWFGRLLMLLSLPLLPVVAVLLATDQLSIGGWGIALVAFLIYGVGTLLSGSTFLALVRESAPPAAQGRALSIVQIFLVVSFPLAAIVYGRMMPDYDQGMLWILTLTGSLVATICWFFSLLGEERRGQRTTQNEQPIAFRVLLREMWAERRTRLFFVFLALGATSAFAQDAVLEPFGGDVFSLSAGETTRFNAYWGGGVVISMIATVVFTRGKAAYQQVGTTALGLALTAAPLALLGITAISGLYSLLIPTLVLFGLGFGIYTVGAVSLLMAMTADQRAGAYLGLWTVAQLVFRGIGVALGGGVRDLMYSLSGSYPLAYAAVFLLEAIGLLLCIPLIIAVDVPGFARRQALVPAANLAAMSD
jgi:MFS transporter, BCD family, chlorophyll transporter